MVQMLIERGAETAGSMYSEETPIDRAVTNGNYLFAFKSNKYRLLFINTLLDFSYLGHVKVAEILLKNGANVQGQSYRYRDSTPLHVACLKGNEPMVRLLIEHGAKVDATDSMIKTPIHLSKNCNGMQMIIS